MHAIFTMRQEVQVLSFSQSCPTYINFYNVNYDVFKTLRPDVGLIDIKTSSLYKYLNDSKILSNASFFHDAAGSPSFKFVKVVQGMLILITLTTTF